MCKGVKWNWRQGSRSLKSWKDKWWKIKMDFSRNLDIISKFTSEFVWKTSPAKYLRICWWQYSWLEEDRTYSKYISINNVKIKSKNVLKFPSSTDVMWSTGRRKRKRIWEKDMWLWVPSEPLYEKIFRRQLVTKHMELWRKFGIVGVCRAQKAMELEGFSMSRS